MSRGLRRFVRNKYSHINLILLYYTAVLCIRDIIIIHEIETEQLLL